VVERSIIVHRGKYAQFAFIFTTISVNFQASALHLGAV